MINPVPDFSNPDDYLSGNYCGSMNVNGTHSAWMQIDGGYFVQQIKLTNINAEKNETYTRVKINNTDWGGIAWIRLAKQEEIPFQHYIETNVIPSELSTVYQYSNPAIAGKPCVIVMFPNTVGTAVVCAGSPTYINMRTKADNQYWGGEIAVDYDSTAGTVSFSVLWKGESQTLNNFGLKGIRY